MEKKAKFIKALYNRNPFGRHTWEHTDLLYEYRGHEYIITKDNNGYMGTPLWKQHQEEQAKIDYKIAHENDPIPEWKYEGSAQEGFDLFWKEITEGEDDD